MKTYLDCIPCFLRQSLEATRNVTQNPCVQEQILRDLLRSVSELDLNRPPPLVGQLIHRKLRQLTGVHDPYLADKARFNQLVTDLLPELNRNVKRAAEPLLAAVKIATAANAIDMGTSANYGDTAARNALLEACDKPLHGDWSEFRRAANKATNILYLADNCGEIVADRLLIEELGANRITLVTRGAPILNDATLDDAHALKLHELVEVVDNGSDAPGTILEDCSASFRQRFDRADLIIAKGQGNFETLSDVDSNIFFLFKAKCPVIAEHIGLPVGVHVLSRVDGRRREACAGRVWS